MKSKLNLLKSLLLMGIMGMSLSSCLLDGEAEAGIDGGGSGGGGGNNSAIVGTWVYKDLGVNTSLVRTYVFNSDGTGTEKEVWTNNGDKELAPSETWEEHIVYQFFQTAGYILINGYEHKCIVSGSKMTLNGYEYTKQ